MLEQIFVEILCLSLLIGLSYAVTLVYTITPYDRSLNKFDNTLKFLQIPVAIYVCFRIYFSLSFFIGSKIPKVFNINIGMDSPLHHFYFFSGKIVSATLGLVGVSAAAFHPQSKSVVTTIYDEYLGNMPSLLYDASKPGFKASYDFGLKLLGLIVGWFVLLFAIELVLKLILFGIRGLFRALLGKKVNEGNVESPEVKESNEE